MIRLDELEQKAKAATQGRWTAGPYGSVVCADNGDESTHSDEESVKSYGGHLVGESFRPKNSDYVAAMSPTTALALIRVARAAINWSNDIACVSSIADEDLIESLKEIEA